MSDNWKPYSEAFLAIFSRFLHRRGCPLQLLSDNGKNFVGAEKTLANVLFQHLVNPQRVHIKLKVCSGTLYRQWILIWEVFGRLGFKDHFRKVAYNFKYTYEEFKLRRR